MDNTAAYLGIAYDQSKLSLNMAIQNLLCRVRDGYVDQDSSCEKFTVLAGTEVALFLNIPIALIEIVVRAALAIIFCPCRTKETDNFSWVGAILSSCFAINNIIALIRGLNFCEKIDICAQIRTYTPCLYEIKSWTVSTPSEFARDPRRIVNNSDT